MQIASWLILAAAVAALPLQAAPEKLAPWTTGLRDQQPDDASAAVYKVEDKRLVFVGAKHENRADSLTFRMIDDAYRNFKFDTVIAEGFATSRGANPPSIIKYAAENGANRDGFVEAGETVPTALGAQKENAALWGGEPDDKVVKALTGAAGISPADLLGFYVLRNIPQWIAEKKIESAGDPRLEQLVVAALARNREVLQISPDVLRGYSEWSAWYATLNKRPIGSDFVTEEVGPLADGRFGSNRIAYAVSKARDTHLHTLTTQHLNAGESVLVVFGASHLMIHRPALDDVLGKPCYVGRDLALAATMCR